MKYVLKQGRHRAKPPVFSLWFGKKTLHRKVYFHTNCGYSLEGEDMFDVNKLYGIGYLWNHHQNSARFGWRYNPMTEKIIISAYCYDKGERIVREMCEIDRNRWYSFGLTIIQDRYLFQVNEVTKDYSRRIASASISFTHKKKWSYRLGIYFGGNKPSPREMHIEIKKR